MTNVRLQEKQLGGVPWVVLEGEPLAAFRRLGQWGSERIKAVVDESGILPPIRERVATPAGAHQLAAVRRETQASYPVAWAELEETALGAGVEFDDLVLLNLRGDLGRGGGAGCTDLAYAGEGGAFIAHNEDGHARLHGHCTWLTLALDGQPRVALWWYPGFVTANTFTATEHGLAWAVDHIGILQPPERPGRHFVARGLQAATDLEDAIAYLRDHPSAGDFTYTMGQVGNPRPVVVESAGGRSERFDVEGTFCWHTNHLRRFESGYDDPSADSLRRGKVMEATEVPAAPDAEWLLRTLTAPSYPQGVFKDPVDADGSTTLVTSVVDLLAGTALLQARDHEPVSIPLDELVAG